MVSSPRRSREGQGAQLQHLGTGRWGRSAVGPPQLPAGGRGGRRRAGSAPGEGSAVSSASLRRTCTSPDAGESTRALRPQARPGVPMSGRPCSWLFRVTLAAAALLRPEPRARPLAVRPAARSRSPVPGKCAASLQPPGLRRLPSARSRAQDPRSRLEGQCGLGRCPIRVVCARGAPAEPPLQIVPTGARREPRGSCARVVPAPPPAPPTTGAGPQGTLRPPSSPRRCQADDPIPTPPSFAPDAP